MNLIEEARKVFSRNGVSTNSVGAHEGTQEMYADELISEAFKLLLIEHSKLTTPPQRPDSEYKKYEFDLWFHKLMRVDNPCFFRDILREQKLNLWHQYKKTADEYHEAHLKSIDIKVEV